MHSSCLCAPVLAISVLLSCGGGTPPPKNEAPEPGSSSQEPNTAQAPSADPSPPAPSSEPTQTASEQKSAPGDLVAPASDDPWMAGHQMPANDVHKTMRAAQGKVNACWRAAKKRDPSVGREVKIKFVITHDGGVRVWRNEESAVSDEDCINCIGGVIQSLRFPKQKSPGDAWGIYQITFGS